MRVIRSSTGVIHGRGSGPWKWVSGLTPRERVAVRMGWLVWIRDKEAWHHNQSGIKVVLFRSGKYFHREPNPAEVDRIRRSLRKGGK